MSFLISKDGQELGPFTVDQVNTQLAGGMLEPTDLGWTEGFDDWYPLNQIEGFVMPETQVAPTTEAAPAEVAADDSAPGLMTGAAAAASGSGRSRWVWGGAVALVLVGGLGAYQLVFGRGDLDSLCNVLVETIIPPKPPTKVVVPVKVIPVHVKKYMDAATAAESGKTPIDAINYYLDLRGDFHFTRGVKGLSAKEDPWLGEFSTADVAGSEGQAFLDQARNNVITNSLQLVDAYGMSSHSLTPGDHRHTAMIHHPTNATGRLWQVLGTNSPPLNELRFMPANTVMAVHGQVNLDSLIPWLGEIAEATKDQPWMVSLNDSLQKMKKEIPLQLLQDTWAGEFGLYLTLNSQKSFNITISGGERIKLQETGFLLVLRLKDDQLGKKLIELFEGRLSKTERTRGSGVQPTLQIYKAPELPAELESLEFTPTLAAWGNYLVLASHQTLASGAIRQMASTPGGQMAMAEKWAQLHGTTRVSRKTRINYVSVPKANLVCFVAADLDVELSPWEKLSFWKENKDSALCKALKSLAATSQGGGLLTVIEVLPTGVIHRARVRGNGSSQTMSRAKEATRLFVTELVPQLAALARRHWPKTESKPETPDKPESSDGN